MELFIVVIAILFLQVWGADNPLHKDQWFDDWLSFTKKQFSASAEKHFAFTVAVPVLVLAVAFWLIGQKMLWPLVPLGVIVLLYSFGRGEFGELVQAYTKACYQEDWKSGIERAQSLRVDVEGIRENDWDSLHRHVLEEAAYRGFERMFAVLFWFFIFGPLGALAYRLTFLFCEKYQDNAPAKKFLWLSEWPAVRVLGLSFALTGNFMGCIRKWRESLLCVVRPTKMTIGQSVLGALSVEEGINQTCDVTRKELSLMNQLYLRTLWFWLAATAIYILFN
ncbi:MAG: regulatory signaling modulator protein AmpE [Agarilytica sp.]